MHDNLRGDIVSITDTSGNVVAQYHYDPWGNCVSSSGSLVQPMRYAGYYYDDETGLYYLKSRYYSPALGRFLTRDGIGFINHSNPQTLNLYSYCKNNPVSLTDPNGNWASEEEQQLAYLTWDSQDYNDMCDLGFRWWEEPENQAQIEADANNLRAKNNVPPFGSLSKSVFVQETERGVARLWMYDMSASELFPGFTFIIGLLCLSPVVFDWQPIRTNKRVHIKNNLLTITYYSHLNTELVEE